MTNKQKYSVATMLAIGSLQSVISRLEKLPFDSKDAIEFAKKIDPFYTKKDGFVPQKVRKLCGL